MKKLTLLVAVVVAVAFFGTFAAAAAASQLELNTLGWSPGMTFAIEQMAEENIPVYPEYYDLNTWMSPGYGHLLLEVKNISDEFVDCKYGGSWMVFNPSYQPERVFMLLNTDRREFSLDPGGTTYYDIFYSGFRWDPSMGTTSPADVGDSLHVTQIGIGFEANGVREYLTLTALPGEDIFAIEVVAPLPQNSVPVPAAIWLLGSGLAGLVVSRRRKK